MNQVMSTGLAESANLEAFLGRLVVPPDQFLEVRRVVPDVTGAYSTFCRSHREAAAVAVQWNCRANVYIGACPRAERSGGREAVRLASGAWADLDFHQLEPHDREHAERLAHERLRSLGRTPTMVVHTGNGLQAWWLFTSPIPITDDQPAERLEAINRGLARVLGGDAVHDLARVLRVPGTLNLPDARKRARGCVPVLARLLQADGPTHAPGDFADIAVDAAPNTTGARRHPVVLIEPQQPQNEILGAFRRLLDQLGSRHPLSRTWRGDRLLKDSSRSGWDMALINHLVGARIRDEFIPTIVRAFRHGRGVFATDAYISRSLAKARASRRTQDGAA